MSPHVLSLLVVLLEASARAAPDDGVGNKGLVSHPSKLSFRVGLELNVAHAVAAEPGLFLAMSLERPMHRVPLMPIVRVGVAVAEVISCKNPDEGRHFVEGDTDLKAGVEMKAGVEVCCS